MYVCLCMCVCGFIDNNTRPKTKFALPRAP